MEFGTKQKKLTNFKVIERQDSKGQDYFIIFDENNPGKNNAYFCWEGSVKTGWDDLKKNRDNWKEIEIEWEEKEKGNKVINIWSDINIEDFLI